LAGTLPWSIPALVALVRLGPRNAAAEEDRPWFAYGLLWMLAPLLVFTPARNIVVTYVMPGLPGFALVAAFLLARLSEQAAGFSAPRPLRRGVLIACGLLAPIALLASVPALRAIAPKRSQKAVVERFEALGGFEEADLYFYGELRSSGAFYSAGRARGIPHDDVEALEQVLRGAGSAVVASQPQDLGRLSPATLERVEEIDRVGRYLLLRARQNEPSLPDRLR
jgi:hypothetical protein